MTDGMSHIDPERTFDKGLRRSNVQRTDTLSLDLEPVRTAARESCIVINVKDISWYPPVYCIYVQ